MKQFNGPSTKSRRRYRLGQERFDFRLHFESARLLFSEFTPARIELLDPLRRLGPCSVYALAKAAARNYSNVHGDVAALEAMELVARDTADCVTVPFESVEIWLR